MPTPSLREVQRAFWRSLRAGEPDAALAAVVLPTPALTPDDRIGIYAGMYVWRLDEVLREDYPKLALALGDDFQALVRRYLAVHPSEHPSVRHLGGRLPAFLAADEVGRDRPWLAHLARLELARVNAFDAPDAAPVRSADLCAVPPDAWPGLRFGPVPALEVLHAPWPVHEVWAAPEPVGVAPRATTLRVWRQDFAVFHAAMDPVEAAALAALIDGQRFATVCEAAAEHVPADAAAAEAGSLLARWLEDGLIARFTP